jgi:hypothetical protein
MEANAFRMHTATVFSSFRQGMTTVTSMGFTERYYLGWSAPVVVIRELGTKSE